MVAASALASGTGTSAGDQQYVDPLTTTTATTHASTAPTTTSSSTSPPASSSSSATTASTTTTPTTTTSSTSPAATGAGGTLPFTGLNVEACVAVGLGLLGTGLILRRTIARV